MSEIAPLRVLQGDITKVEAEAIVNAANPALAMGGGVCGAIFQAAGPEALTAACREIGGCATGAAVATPAFGIAQAKVIVHAVGPVYAEHSPEEARRLLRAAYAASIEVARQEGCRSIAFPAISTGIYGYPPDEAAVEAVAVCRAEAAKGELAIMLVAFDDATATLLRNQF